jgi:hypothetical protein
MRGLSKRIWIPVENGAPDMDALSTYPAYCTHAGVLIEINIL